MILTLTNFRCYKKVTFDFPDNGTILLWGTSGIGKTTIFKAINFVLYDKESKVITYGEKKCEVIMQYKTYTITRRKGPTYFMIKNSEDNSLYDNDVAQHKINEIFGDNFLLTGYMPQKNSDRFFLMSNIDKTTFLQSLSIKDFDIEYLRKKVKDEIKLRKDKLTSKSTEKRMLLDQCKKLNIDDNFLLIEPELKLDTKGVQFEEFIIEEDQKSEKIKKQVKEKRQKLEQKIKDVHTQEKLVENINSKKNLLEHLQQRLNELQLEKLKIELHDEDEIEELKDDIDNYKNIIKLIKLKQSFKEAKEEYDSMIEIESKKINEQLNTLTKNIDECNNYILTDEERKIYNKQIETSNKLTSLLKDIKTSDLIDFNNNINSLLQSITIKIEELNNIEFDEELYNQLNELKFQLSKLEEDYKNIIKMLKEGETHRHNCPKCKTGLMIYNNTIKEHNINIEELKKEKSDKELLIKILKDKIKKESDSIKELQNKINEDNQKKNKLEEYKKQLEEYKTFKQVDIKEIKQILDKDISYVTKLNMYKKEFEKIDKIKTLKPDVLPAHLIKKRDNLLKTKKQYDQLKEEIEDYEPLSIEEYEQMILDNNTKLSNIELNIQQINKVNNEMTQLDKNIKECNEFISCNVSEDIELLNKEIEELKESIEKAENNIDKLQKRSERIKKYQKELELYNQKKEALDNYLNVKNEENICIRALSKSEEFNKYINDAESLSLSQTIQNINTDLEEFISAFFGDNFNVSLTTFKQTKDGEKKALIDIQIVKDGEIIPLDGLSGGEYDRVSLALFLAFNKSSKCGLILLDECLASLHPELVEEIVEMIKEKMNNKLVMFTLHQANTGIFDQVIDICKYKCF
jgi:DNA repair protein SbcC/Rad50